MSIGSYNSFDCYQLILLKLIFINEEVPTVLHVRPVLSYKSMNSEMLLIIDMRFTRNIAIRHLNMNVLINRPEINIKIR
jgi:hypothetical protein